MTDRVQRERPYRVSLGVGYGQLAGQTGGSVSGELAYSLKKDVGVDGPSRAIVRHLIGLEGSFWTLDGVGPKTPTGFTLGPRYALEGATDTNAPFRVAAALSTAYFHTSGSPTVSSKTGVSLRGGVSGKVDTSPSQIDPGLLLTLSVEGGVDYDLDNRAWSPAILATAKVEM